MCCFDQILEVAHHKTTVVWPLTSHHTNHPSKMNKSCWTLLWTPTHGYTNVWFDLLSLFNGISTFMGYLIPNPNDIIAEHNTYPSCSYTGSKGLNKGNGERERGGSESLCQYFLMMIFKQNKKFDYYCPIIIVIFREWNLYASLTTIMRQRLYVL